MDWTRVTPFQTSWQGLYHAWTEGSSEPNQPFAKISAAACAALRQDSATSATFRVASATKNPAAKRIPSLKPGTRVTKQNWHESRDAQRKICSASSASSRGHGPE